MEDGLRVSDTVLVPWSELRWRFSRAGGPGGQYVNTTDSRVELSFDIAASRVLPDPLKDRARERLAGRLVGDVLTVVASEHRSQLQNRRAAAARLAALLAAAIAPPAAPRRPTRPSRRAVERRLAEKKHRARRKQDRRPPPE